MEAIKVVVLGRTFCVDPCPECGQAEVRIRREDSTAYAVCPCCDGQACFPDEHVREMTTMVLELDEARWREEIGDSSYSLNGWEVSTPVGGAFPWMVVRRFGDIEAARKWMENLPGAEVLSADGTRFRVSLPVTVGQYLCLDGLPLADPRARETPAPKQEE
jgi:hypothetical protein